MDPELIKAALNWGFPAVIILWGLVFFQTKVWPEFTGHLTKVGEMVDSIKVVAINTNEVKEIVKENNALGEELLSRIPKRVEQDHR